MKTIAIIQARGGSKGIPLKNIKMIAGKPLIAWTIEAARASKLVTRVIVNTDDEEIARVAREYGAEVPFMRPAEFATDKSPSLPLFEHALRWFAEHEAYQPDVIVQLKPTNPLRTAAQIDEGIELFFAPPECDSLLSVHETHDHPYKIWKPSEGGLMEPFLPESYTGLHDAARMRRQDLPKALRHNGAVNVIAPATIIGKHSMNGDRIKPYEIDEESALNIDTLRDFSLAELILKERLELE